MRWRWIEILPRPIGLLGLARFSLVAPKIQRLRHCQRPSASARAIRRLTFGCRLRACKGQLASYQQAVVWLRRAVEANRNYHFAYFWLASGLAQLDRLDEAHSAVKAGLAINPVFSVSRARAALDGAGATIRRIWPSSSRFSTACARPGSRRNERDPETRGDPGRDVAGYSWRALLLALLSLAARAGAAEYYGYDQGGSRFAPLDQITPGNVDQLIPAWTYHTGDLKSRAADVLKRSKFEVTPILVGDKLIACTPFNAVVALDPGTGQELWRYDPEIKTDYRPANMFNCRGVAVWRGPAGAAGPCAERILTATADLRLIALDLKDGRPCADFGQDGAVRIDPGKPLLWPGEFQFTSPPAVIGDLVILGSSIADNARVDAPRGTVRAFDVRTGAPRWQLGPGAGARRRPGCGELGRRLADDRRRQCLGADRDRRGARPDVPADDQPEPGFLRRLTPRRQSPRQFGGRPQGRDRRRWRGATSSSTTISGITTSRPSRASPRSPSTARSATSSSRAPSRGWSSCSTATPASPSCRSKSARCRRAASRARRCRRPSPSRPICRRSAPTASRRSRRGG